MPGPTFLVVGTARSGTTAVVEGLRRHRDVFITQPKEPHYFAFHGTVPHFQGPGDDHWINQVAVTDRDDYLALYDEAGAASARGDGSVSTLYYSAHAADEIARLNPEMKLVVVLREPVARAFSNYTYLRLRGVETEPDFRSGLQREEQRIAANWHHMWHYASLSHYFEDVRRLVETVGRERVGIWFYDDLDTDFDRVLDEVARFLDLSSLPAGAAMPRVNASGSARVEAAQRAIRWATSHQSVRSAVKAVVPFRVRERIRSGVIRSEEVPTDVRAELAPRFEDDLRQLAQLLGGEQPDWLAAYDG
jgi:Sulfotransferase domain